MKTITIVLSILICSFNCSYSQTNPEKIDDLYVDFSIPDNTAYKILGIESNKVTRPGNLKELSFYFLNLISSGSSIQQGLAFEWAPMQTFAKSVKGYSNMGIFRDLSFSLATAKANKNESGSDVAFGLSILPINKSNPVLDLSLRDTINNIASSQPPSFLNKTFQEKIIHLDTNIYNSYTVSFDELFKDLNVANFSQKGLMPNIDKIITDFKNQVSKDNGLLPDVYLTDLRAFLQLDYPNYLYLIQYGNYSDDHKNEIIKDVLNKFKRDKWNAEVLQINAGIVYNSVNSTWQKLTYSRASAFIGYCAGFGQWGQLIINAQYTSSTIDSITNGISIGSRLLAGNSDTRGSLDFMLSSAKNKNVTNRENKLKTALGFEFKISDGVWLETAVGVEDLLSSLKNSTIISLANFKYTFNKNPRFFKES